MSKSVLNPNGPSQCVYAETWHDMIVVISCSGTIDLLTAADLENLIATVLSKQPTALIFDLANVDFLACRGMSVLVDTRTHLAGSVPLIVVADGPATARPMMLVGLTELIRVHATLEAALNDLTTEDDVRNQRT